MQDIPGTKLVKLTNGILILFFDIYIDENRFLNPNVNQSFFNYLFVLTIEKSTGLYSLKHVMEIIRWSA